MTQPNNHQQNLKAETTKLLSKPNLKIALISDIHANLYALERVFEDAEQHKPDFYLNMGDSIGFGPNPNEVIELLCKKKVSSILGNFDLEVMEGKAKSKGEKEKALRFARKELSKSCEDSLGSFPFSIRFEVANKKLLATHGSPESIEEHIYHDTPIERLKVLVSKANADIIILGHTHEQFKREVNGSIFVNPGSVGRPNDGNPKAAYAILSFNPTKVELIRVDYDSKKAANVLRKKGLPESFSQMLLKGVSLETIIEEDKSKEDQMTHTCTRIADTISEISMKYWPVNEHFLQVSKLGLKLFDDLQELHNLGLCERCWLECAAILHDIGLSKARNGHHKKTAELILNDNRLPFTSQERRIIASIARYHRKALPRQSHYNLKTLNRVTIEKVKMLSSILRLADGLDYTHQTCVEDIAVKAGTRRITVRYKSETKSSFDEQAFYKKKDLFEKVFNKKLVLEWKQP